MKWYVWFYGMRLRGVNRLRDMLPLTVICSRGVEGFLKERGMMDPAVWAN